MSSTNSAPINKATNQITSSYRIQILQDLEKRLRAESNTRYLSGKVAEYLRSIRGMV